MVEAVGTRWVDGFDGAEEGFGERGAEEARGEGGGDGGWGRSERHCGGCVVFVWGEQQWQYGRLHLSEVSFDRRKMLGEKLSRALAVTASSAFPAFPDRASCQGSRCKQKHSNCNF